MIWSPEVLKAEHQLNKKQNSSRGNGHVSRAEFTPCQAG